LNSFVRVARLQIYRESLVAAHGRLVIGLHRHDVMKAQAMAA
jgi:hypothetical protein